MGRVIQIIRVTWVAFCPDRVDLVHFIKYLGLTQMGSHVHKFTSSILLMEIHVHTEETYVEPCPSFESILVFVRIMDPCPLFYRD